MNLLLDTHTFIWWDRDPAKLTPAVLQRLQSPDNQVLLSLVSLWEIQIKTQLGKLTLRGHLADIVQQQQIENDLRLLPIEVPHIFALEDLPQHHRDPFDRLLIAQSLVEQATLVSRDPVFQNYDCQVLW
jgi:PIN domain nuclease of toxin-antitoxin system